MRAKLCTSVIVQSAAVEVLLDSVTALSSAKPAGAKATRASDEAEPSEGRTDVTLATIEISGKPADAFHSPVAASQEAAAVRLLLGARPPEMVAKR